MARNIVEFQRVGQTAVTAVYPTKALAIDCVYIALTALIDPREAVSITRWMERELKRTGCKRTAHTPADKAWSIEVRKG